jgi:hypothetical protein
MEWKKNKHREEDQAKECHQRRIIKCVSAINAGRKASN